jgi:RND family efflux transporter MFP subunit
MVYKMKKYLILFFIIAFASMNIVTSCNKKDDSLEGKKAKLNELMAQHDDLQTKIAKLETEIKSAGNNNSQVKPVNVTIIDMKPGLFRRFIDVQGIVESQKAVGICSRMGGIIINLPISPGQSVKKGDLLLEVDSDPMIKGLNEVEAQLEFVNTLYEKNKRLYDKKAISEIQFLTAKNQKEGLEKKIVTVKRQIENAKTYAPFDGVIDQVVPKIGEKIGDVVPVIRLTSLSDVKVTANISETYGSSFKIGDPALLKFNEVNQTMESRVSMISKSIDQLNRAFKIEIKMPTVPSFIKPNMVCNVSINDITLNDAMVVPLSILQREGDNNFLFVAENQDGKIVAKKRIVKIGVSYKENAQIIEGLKLGDKVIIDGAYDVTDGQLLKVN